MNASFKKIAIATTTFTCATLFSVGWSEQRGVSLSIESAQARVGRPLTPVSVAGVARRNYRRAAYGYGAGAVGAGVAAAAIGTAAVAATSPWGYYDGGPSAYADSYAGNEPTAYARSRPYGASAYHSEPAAYAGSYAYADTGSGWVGGYYAHSAWGAYACQPHHTYDCQHFSEGWQY
jgi:hypothetical protein